MWQAPNYICTVAAIRVTAIRLNNDFSDYNKVVNSQGMAMARCDVWKQSHCRGSTCQSKKRVTCRDVCEIQGAPKNGKYNINKCYADICDAKTCDGVASLA